MQVRRGYIETVILSLKYLNVLVIGVDARIGI